MHPHAQSYKVRPKRSPSTVMKSRQPALLCTRPPCDWQLGTLPGPGSSIPPPPPTAQQPNPDMLAAALTLPPGSYILPEVGVRHWPAFAAVCSPASSCAQAWGSASGLEATLLIVWQPPCAEVIKNPAAHLANCKPWMLAGCQRTPSAAPTMTGPSPKRQQPSVAGLL
jgi:hypothetical protein